MNVEKNETINQSKHFYQTFYQSSKQFYRIFHRIFRNLHAKHFNIKCNQSIKLYKLSKIQFVQIRSFWNNIRSRNRYRFICLIVCNLIIYLSVCMKCCFALKIVEKFNLFLIIIYLIRSFFSNCFTILQNSFSN